MEERNDLLQQIERAAAAIQAADALLIGAGAGMGVDSGLPDFRGNEGFWKAYPPFRHRGLSFYDLANPRWFRADPAQAWGFYGHRLNLYRATAPHAGFQMLRRWGEAKPAGYFVFTSNVDGHFQQAGFADDRILECHGSIHHLQCAASCSIRIWPAEPLQVAIDEATFLAQPPLPTCPDCCAVARPNVLMFGDYDWNDDRSAVQQQRYESWLRQIRGQRIAIIECGAGTAVPTVRYECQRQQGTLIRINLREAEVPAGAIGLSCRVSEALEQIAARIV